LREPGIQTVLAVRTAAWIPGSREDARPGMTALGALVHKLDKILILVQSFYT
jgi:hypothetical protein